ncbi:MAG TPA: hypothetical protein VML94_08295 [Thermoplasmata archaeon]|nr:hypothetical protein [Thermoplasmata archaeon]
MVDLLVRCEHGDPVETALGHVREVIKYGYPPTGAGPLWEHLRHSGFCVAPSDGPMTDQPVESPEAWRVGRQFAAAILWTAFRSGGIRWDPKTGLYSVR